MNSAELIGMNNSFFINEKIKDSKGSIYDPVCFSSSKALDNLIEFSGRICYNSGLIGKKNRNSKEYFLNIITEKHYSIFGHSLIWLKVKKYSKALRNYVFSRPRILFRSPNIIGISFRHLIEDIFERKDLDNPIVQELIHIFYDKTNILEWVGISRPKALGIFEEIFYERWFNFLIKTSRRISLELIRHNTEYCVSQESTRYVDKSDYILHTPYNPIFDSLEEEDKKKILSLYEFSNNLYKEISKKYEKSIPRKKLLGMMSDTLLQGCDTTLVYSCTEFQFNKIIEQRLTQYSDPYIYDLVNRMKLAVDTISY